MFDDTAVYHDVSISSLNLALDPSLASELTTSQRAHLQGHDFATQSCRDESGGPCPESTSKS